MGDASEPTLAIDPTNVDNQVATAFIGDPLAGQTAPVFVLNKLGGWEAHFVVPNNGPSGTHDITVAFGSNSSLAITNVRGDLPPVSLDSKFSLLDRFDALEPAKTVAEHLGFDQPFVKAIEGAETVSRTVVGGNQHSALDNKSATIYSPLDGEAIALPKSPNQFQDGPAIRIAQVGSRTVAVYVHCNSNQRLHPNSQTDLRANFSGEIRLLVDDKFQANPGTVLQFGGSPKTIVKVGYVMYQLLGDDPNKAQGQRETGDLSIAIDPLDTDALYIAYCSVNEAKIYTLNLSKYDLKSGRLAPLVTKTNALNPSLAIAIDQGNTRTVGLLYQTFVAAPTPLDRHRGFWETRLLRHRDGLPDDDILLTRFESTTLKVFSSQPFLGDYDTLLAKKNDFYGIFCSGNQPVSANFPGQSIDKVFSRQHDRSGHLLKLSGGVLTDYGIDPFVFTVKQ